MRNYLNLIVVIVVLLSFLACKKPNLNKRDTRVGLPKQVSTESIEYKYKKLEIVVDTAMITPAVAPGETITLKAVGTLQNGSKSQVIVGWGGEYGKFDPEYGTESVYTCPSDAKDIEAIKIWIGGGEAGPQNAGMFLKINYPEEKK